MSQPSSSQRPAALVERIFERFAALYGVQKVAAIYPEGGVNHAYVIETWTDALARFPIESIANAVHALNDRANEWPPTLPEFVDLCKQFHRPEAAVALPPPPPAATPVGLAAAEKIGAVAARQRMDWEDPLHWAKRPKSRIAVEMLVLGCEREPSLRPVLMALLRNPEPCRSKDAADTLDAIRQYPPKWLPESYRAPPAA